MIGQTSELTLGRAFLNVTTAVLLANLLTALILGLGGLVYLAAVTGPASETMAPGPVSAACSEAITAKKGQIIDAVPPNCASDDPKAVAGQLAVAGIAVR